MSKFRIVTPKGASFTVAGGGYDYEKEALDPIGAEIVEAPANEAEFIAAAKAKPGKVACASLGASTLGYLLTKQFELIVGLEMVDVPYKGSALAYPDLMNGTVAVMLDNPSGSAGLVREKRLTGFAVTRPSAAVRMRVTWAWSKMVRFLLFIASGMVVTAVEFLALMWHPPRLQ